MKWDNDVNRQWVNNCIAAEFFLRLCNISVSRSLCEPCYTEMNIFIWIFLEPELLCVIHFPSRDKKKCNAGYFINM